MPPDYTPFQIELGLFEEAVESLEQERAWPSYPGGPTCRRGPAICKEMKDRAVHGRDGTEVFGACDNAAETGGQALAHILQIQGR